MNRTPIRVLVLVAVTVATAALATGLSWPDPGPRIPWLWLAVCFAAELLWVRLPLGGSCVTMAMAAHFAALLLLPRGEAMLAALVSGLVAERLALRKPALRALFNSAQATLAVGAASFTIAALGAVLPASGPVPNLLAVAAGGAAYFLVNTGAVSLAIALDRRVPVLDAWRTNFGTRGELTSAGALVSLGTLIAGLLPASGLPVLALGVLPVLVTWQSFRGWLEARQPRPDATEVRRAA